MPTMFILRIRCHIEVSYTISCFQRSQLVHGKQLVGFSPAQGGHFNVDNLPPKQTLMRSQESMEQKRCTIQYTHQIKPINLLVVYAYLQVLWWPFAVKDGYPSLCCACAGKWCPSLLHAKKMDKLLFASFSTFSAA